MPALKTMFQLTGRGYAAANLSNASLLTIDAQNEYLSGPLALSGMDAATANIARLLKAARKAAPGHPYPSPGWRYVRPSGRAWRLHQGPGTTG